MDRRTYLKAMLAGAAALLWSGCGKQGDRPVDRPADQLLRNLKLTGPERGLAAHELSLLPAEQLKPVAAQIEAALNDEKDAGVRRELQKALEKARSE